MTDKKTGYIWGWTDEGTNWNCENTIKECLVKATENILIEYTPEEFIEMMNNHCLYVYIAEDIVRNGYIAGKMKKYRLAMSGQWYLVKGIANAMANQWG